MCCRFFIIIMKKIAKKSFKNFPEKNYEIILWDRYQIQYSLDLLCVSIKMFFG